MKRWKLFALTFATAAIGVLAILGGAAPAESQSTTDAQTEAIVAASRTFLNSLSAAERSKVQFLFTPQKTATAAPFGRIFVGEKYGQAMWSNFPVSDVPRPGLTMGSLNAAQRSSAMNTLKLLLSPEGYQKVIDIMDADQVLSESGTPYDDGTAFYTLGMFGVPSATAPWMLEFGGHHLALNVVVAGPNVSLTPTLTGDQPATYTRNGQTVRPLGKENDKAFQLVNALSPELQQKATLNYEIRDLVLGPGQDGRTLPPEGLPASEMTEAQRAILLDLIGEWVRLLNADDAAPKLARIKADIEHTYFAWHGPTTNPSPVYFRITGPTLHIEFAHQGGRASGVQAGGINHVHTIYRDPTNEYGMAWTLK